MRKSGRSVRFSLRAVFRRRGRARRSSWFGGCIAAGRWLPRLHQPLTMAASSGRTVGGASWNRHGRRRAACHARATACRPPAPVARAWSSRRAAGALAEYRHGLSQRLPANRVVHPYAGGRGGGGRRAVVRTHDFHQNRPCGARCMCGGMLEGGRPPPCNPMLLPRTRIPGLPPLGNTFLCSRCW